MPRLTVSNRGAYATLWFGNRSGEGLMSKPSDRESKRRGFDVTRRDVVRGIGAAGGVIAAAPLARRASAQARAPMTLRFWSNDQPQQREWYQRRFKLFTTPTQT